MDASLDDTQSLLPDDTSRLFYILGKRTTRAIYFDSYEAGADTYRLVFDALKNYRMDSDVLTRVLRIFDDNIESLEMLDDKNYKLSFKGEVKPLTDQHQHTRYTDYSEISNLLPYQLRLIQAKSGQERT